MISRRDFLKSAGVAALAVATTGMLAGCSVPTNPDAPAPSEPETPAASNTVTLADGVTLTITGTVREKVIPSGSLQYLAVKFKLNNETEEDVTISEDNFKTNLNGKWEFPIASDELSDSQKKFLFEKADAPYIDYYSEPEQGTKPGKGPKDGVKDNMGVVANGQGFGAAGTDLEAAVCFLTKSTDSKMDLMVTYDAKVFKFNLAI